jgi:transposase
MNFTTAARLGSLLSKDYAEAMFELLVNYRALSASEAAARLNLHIKTAQDFLEGLAEHGIVSREEVLEGKRPYFRYILQQEQIKLELDLTQVRRSPEPDRLSLRIRERENSGARFTTTRGADAINSVTTWTGEGRDRQEKRIKLTAPQGKFLYHLPFPNTRALAVNEIMRKAGIEPELAAEILDLVRMLEQYAIIESTGKSR